MFDLPKINNDRFFPIDFKCLTEDVIVDKWEDFKKELSLNTELCLNCMGLAMHQFILNELDNCVKSLEVIRPRLINYEPILKLADLKVNCYGKTAQKLSLIRKIKVLRLR